MRLSVSTVVLMFLTLGSCAKAEDVVDTRAYAEAVEQYVLDVEHRFDRRLDELEARMDETEIYASEACARLNC